MGCWFSTGSAGKKLSAASIKKADELFKQLDIDGDGEITKEEAKEFFSRKSKLNSVSADAMFSEVDDDRSETITKTEFMGFWEQVRRSGYTNNDIENELDSMIQGSSWVDWRDERSTGHA
mmetsp:Transcript_89121/g.171510  ORF Transcript_89121/g.171510 Transcript_89121/m.171510 type:complete len:120 (+) Transcript_89121:137-496(+)